MQEVYESMDTYKDEILKRIDFITALRTNEHVLDFLD